MALGRTCRRASSKSSADASGSAEAAASVDFNGGGETGFTLATFNVLGSTHTGPGGKAARLGSGPQRIHGVVDLLDQYGVDVVGLQEFQSPQARAFLGLAG